MSIHAHETLKLGRPGGPSTKDAITMAEITNFSQLQKAPYFACADTNSLDVIGLFGNNTQGCCTCATEAGVLIGDAAAKGQTIDFATAAVLNMYKASGWDGTPATDNGWTLADAANYMQHTGLPDTAGTIHKFGPWCQINYLDFEQVMLALDMFGSMPVGISLPTAFQDMSKPWDVVPDSQGGTPGSWGGHSLTLVRADGRGMYLRTWGVRQFITREAWSKYVDEALIKIDPLWVSDTSLAPTGFDLNYLLSAQKVFV